MNSSTHVKLIQPRDYIQDGLHLAALAAIAIGAACISPIVVACSMLYAVVKTIRTKRQGEEFLLRERQIKPEIPFNDRSGARLFLDDFLKRTGCKRDVRIFSEPGKSSKDFDANSAGLRNPRITFSKPALNLLVPKETRAVVGHELTHIEARSTELKLVASALCRATTFAFVPTVLTGSMKADLLLAAGGLGSQLLVKSLGRRQEFQADRGAVAMGGDALGLIKALRKLETATLQDHPVIASLVDWRTGSAPARGVKMIASVFKDHPDTLRRCERLAKLAARNGRDAEAIKDAMLARVDTQPWTDDEIVTRSRKTLREPTLSPSGMPGYRKQASWQVHAGV